MLLKGLFQESALLLLSFAAFNERGAVYLAWNRPYSFSFSFNHFFAGNRLQVCSFGKKVPHCANGGRQGKFAARTTQAEILVHFPQISAGFD